MLYNIKQYFILLLLSVSAFASKAQDVDIYDADKLMNRLANGKDTLYVVNFWATWCGPCIKEMPLFDTVANRYQGKPVKILLVSLDFKNDYPKKIQKFINKKELKHEVVWFSETKANEFIPKINNEWQGSIPATLLYYKKSNYERFFEGKIISRDITVLIDKQISVRY